MDCLQHGAMESPLARYCPECGASLAFATIDKEPIHRLLPYRDSTLVGYGEVFFVCDCSGMVHALDANLDDLAEPLSCPDLLSEIAPGAAEGYLYFARSQGLFVVDLVAWVQDRESEATLLLPTQRIQCMLASGNHVSAVVSVDGSIQLMSWKGQSVTAQIPLSGFRQDLYTFAPVVTSEFAFVTQRSSNAGTVCVLQDCMVKEQDLGGACLHTTASHNGVACLVESNDKKRIIEFTSSGVTILVPSVPADTTWILCGASPELFLSGNGSSLTLHRNRGHRQYQENGNIGMPSVSNGYANAIARDAVSSEALSINLLTGNIGSAGRIGDFSFSEIVCAGNRLVAGNGRQLNSIAVEKR